MFGKIFEQIYDSSIAEDWTVRMVFQDFIVLADINGVVNRTHESIARRTNVPIDIVRKAIAVLEEPDPRSQSPVADGRRIVRLDEHRDWGWQIVNYKHYRDIASDEQRREKTRERVRKFRSENHLGPCNDDVTLCNAGNAMQRQRQRERKKQMEEGGEEPHLPEIPTEEEAVTSMSLEMIPPDFIRMVYSKWSERQGRDGAGVIVDFRKHVRGRWKNEQVQWKNGTHRCAPPSSADSHPPLDPEKYSVKIINGKRVVRDAIRGHVIEGM